MERKNIGFATTKIEIEQEKQKKARLLDLVTGVLEMVRDGDRNIDSFSAVLQIIKNEKDGLKRLLGNLAVATPVPADGEIFELTIDGDAPENDPIEMVKWDGYREPEKWQFNGKKVTGTQTRHFKLVSVGYCFDLSKVRQELAKRGAIPEGQWCEAFKFKYPRSDGQGPIGFADPAWVAPGGGRCFLYLRDGGRAWDWDPRFSWVAFDLRGPWRWLVEVR